MSFEITEGDLIVRRESAAGVIRLNRPKAINALTLEMTREMDRALDTFVADPAVALILLEGTGERGLCAGGDIRGLYDSAREKGDLGPVFWREEYILDDRIARFPKPYVAYMDGLATTRPRSACRRSASASFPMSAAPGCCRARRARSAPISA